MSTSKAEKALSLLIVTYTLYLGGASAVRNRVEMGPTAESEGWSWAESFNYQNPTITQDIRRAFHDIHMRMQKDSRKLRDGIWGDDKADAVDNSNVNLLRISFIISSHQPNTPPRLYETKLFQKHVFLSAATPPTTHRKFECNTDYAFSVAKLDAHDSSKYPGEKAFIYPPLQDVTTDKIIKRLQSRYRLVDQAQLPKVASLARIYNDQLSDEEVLAWFNEANRSAEHFQGSEARASDAPVFFKHLHDSEQKVMYYLDHLSGWMALFPSLKNGLSFLTMLDKTIENIKTFFLAQKAYKAQQIKAFMTSAPQETDAEKKESAIKYDETIAKNIHALATLVERRPSVQQPNFDEKRYLLGMENSFKQLEACSYVMKDCMQQVDEYSKFFSQDGGLAKKDLSPTALKLLLEKEPIEKGQISRDLSILSCLLKSVRPRTATLEAAMASWNEWVEQLRDMWLSEPEDASEIAHVLSKLRRLRICLRTDRTVKQYQAEPFPREFVDEVKASVSVAGGSFISGIILHVHSTNDVCYTCAPDLAQESRRTEGFADDFGRFIEEINSDDSWIRFQIINSCETIRPCRLYTKQQVEKEPKLFQANGLTKIRFYQHQLEPPAEPEQPLQTVKDFTMPDIQAQPYLEDDDEAPDTKDEGQKALEGGASSSSQKQGNQNSGAKKTDDDDADPDDKAKKVPEDAGTDMSSFDLDALGEF